MPYVDGFILPLPKAKLADYKAIAEKARDVWMELGALSYVEAIADDVSAGELTSFPRAVHLEEDEIVVFSWITYESREARDSINQKVMADPRMKDGMENCPFDGKRMIYGGFTTFVEN